MFEHRVTANLKRILFGMIALALVFAPVQAASSAKADIYGAIMEGAVDRVRPKMMTVAAIIAGLLPILWSTGTVL